MKNKNRIIILALFGLLGLSSYAQTSSDCEGLVGVWKRIWNSSEDNQKSACKGQYKPEGSSLDPNRSFTLFNEKNKSMNNINRIF